ncbi:MAG: putative rane protein [Candidatus Eremiobacteraeota bacterium]|jgi:putative membrane protein|nr:putative rane protein [Candidatus Eremiobacteraeota bacterium]
MRQPNLPRTLAALVAAAGVGGAALAANAQSQPTFGAPGAASLATLAPQPGGATLAQLPLPAVTMIAPTSDAEFALLASATSNGEIATARETLRRSRNPLVRRFAQRMIDDHTGANVGLQAATRGAGTRPAPVTALDPDAQRQLDALRSVPDPQFDATYMLAQIPDHQKAIGIFGWEAQNGRNPTLRDYANRTLPNLQMHLQMAQAFRASNGATIGDVPGATLPAVPQPRASGVPGGTPPPLNPSPGPSGAP